MPNSWRLRFLILAVFCVTLCLGCSTGTVIGSGSQASEPVTDGVYNIKQFGARGDGVTDDAPAIQKAADKARDEGGTLLIPAGNYLIKSRVRLYTSVVCQGKFIIENGTAASVTISRWVKMAKLQPAGLTGWERGSTHINGLKGYAGGTLVLKSTEKLVERQQWGSDYTKNDTSEITSSDGDIWPALDCTYKDLSRLSVTVYEYEKPIVISGLTVESRGDAPGKGRLVYCVRSNVTLDHPVIINTSRMGTASCGLNIYDSVNVTVNNPVISNFQPPDGDGYGIALGNDSNIAIYNGKITDCSNHAITGRQDKNVVIKGGTYSGHISPLDNHWGNLFVIEDATLSGESGVTYAGTDITIRNCKIMDCVNILDIRTDTPHIMGKVVIDKVKAYNRKGVKEIYCYRARGQGSAVPDKVLLSNIRADVPQDGFLYYSEINSNNIADYAGKISGKNILTNNSLGTVITRR
jgi:polygalacturonase